MKINLKVLVFAIFISFTFFIIQPATPPTVQSQDGDDDEACSSVVEQALQAIGTACAEVGRNEACYGHVNVEATFREGIEAQFESNGDIVEVGDLESLLTQGANPEEETWGVALINLQADLPDDSEDNVTLLLFGDAEITSAVVEDGEGEFSAPLQAITLRSGETGACEQAPDGLLIRSPEGQRARVQVNGVELTLSSATFITAEAESDMGIQGLEGEIEVTAQGETETVTPGFISTVALDENFEPEAPPTEPEPVEPDVEFPFDVFTGVFPEGDGTTGSTGSSSGGLGNTYTGSSFSFSYPDGWFAQETGIPEFSITPVVVTNNQAMVGQVEGTFSDLPSNTTFLIVYSASDFSALFQGAIGGSTPDELVRSYAELLSFANLVTAGPETVEIGPHAVTRAQYGFDFSATGAEGGSFDIVMYGFGNVIVLQYFPTGQGDTSDPAVQDIIASFTFE